MQYVPPDISALSTCLYLARYEIDKPLHVGTPTDKGHRPYRRHALTVLIATCIPEVVVLGDLFSEPDRALFEFFADTGVLTGGKEPLIVSDRLDILVGEGKFLLDAPCRRLVSESRSA
jgi:hypothetical protein